MTVSVAGGKIQGCRSAFFCSEKWQLGPPLSRRSPARARLLLISPLDLALPPFQFTISTTSLVSRPSPSLSWSNRAPSLTIDTMPNQSVKRSHRRSRGPTHSDSDDEVSSWDSHSVSSSRSASSSSSSSDDALISKLPTLPDLRFEQSYLATIRNFLHEEQPSSSNHHDESEKQPSSADAEEDHHHKVELTHGKAEGDHELWLGNLRVEW